MFRENYPVEFPSDYWKISLYLVFLETLDHLVEEISKRVVSNEERVFSFGKGGGGSYLNPASLLNITPEIVDRLCNAYQRDLPRKKILCMRLSVGKSGGLL